MFTNKQSSASLDGKHVFLFDLLIYCVTLLPFVWRQLSKILGFQSHVVAQNMFRQKCQCMAR